MNQKACSEVYAIINVMDPKTTRKIPQKLLEFIKLNRDVFYNPEFEKLPENFDNLEHDTKVMFAMIYKKYFKENDINYSIKEDECEKSKDMELMDDIEENVKIVEYKENLFTKVKKWFLVIKEKLFR